MTIASESRQLLEGLLTTPSPSGQEEKVQALVRAWCERYADEVKTDSHGNVVAAIHATGRPRILLDGHCDQIALMIQHVDEQGFIYFAAMGGWDPMILVGQAVTVWARSGPMPGVIGRKPKHLQVKADQSRPPLIKDLWIDLGAESAEEVLEKVTIGDAATVRLGFVEFPHDRIAGPKMDNTAGLFVVLETLRRLASADSELRAGVFVVSAVQEEVGLRGAKTAAFGVDPDIGIAVDVTHATDCPTIDPREHGMVRLGEGPVLFRGPNINPVAHRRLSEIAEERQLSLQHKGAPRGTPNDANALQLTRAGVATVALGIPNRYMHTPVEMISLRDLDTAADLLTAFVQSVDEESHFIPGLLDQD